MADQGMGETLVGAVLSIGDELALGQTLDTNSMWIAERLGSLGVRVIEHATVDDDAVRIESAFRRLTSIAGVVVCTGGLGPTADDLTREALAGALGDDLVEDADAAAALEAWYARRGTMPPSNRVQALRPIRASCLGNPHGTAPGLSAELADAGVFCLPGPPHEMRPMFESFVTPWVRARTARVVGTRLVLTFGLGESAVAERLGPLMDRDRAARGQTVVGTTASLGVVTVRLRHEADCAEAARAGLDAAEAEVRGLLGDSVFGRRDLLAGDPGELGGALAGAVVDLLRSRGERLVVAESCTGGGLGAEVTSVAGSSDVFAGGWQTYSNAAKSAMLGVDVSVFERDGAVSRACAEAMARGALERARTLGATRAVSITGIAGPGGGSEAKPVGTVWIGLASVGRAGSIGVEARRFLFRGGRDAVRAWSTRAALGMLRLGLEGISMRLLGEVDEDGSSRPGG